MFRLLRLDPPHGWRAVIWELGIVTAGVLIALAAQQWADELSWRSRTRAATDLLREETAQHYAYAVEWRATHPCLRSQLDTLSERLLRDGDRLEPAPVETASSYRFVIRIPAKTYSRSAWDSVINEGIGSRLDPSLRRVLGPYYSQVDTVNELTRQNSVAEQALVTMSLPLRLDPAVRYALLREIATLRGRGDYLDTINGRLIDHLEKAGMVPEPAGARALTERFGTYRWCKSNRLPMRPFDEAMKAVPN